MTDSKLIELFRSFTARQQSRFGDFLQSPFFNKNGDCLLLYNHVQKYAPAFAHENISRQVILQKLPFGKPMDEKSLAHLASRLMALAEKFLAVEVFLSDDWQQQMALMQQYHELALPKHYKTAAAGVEKSSETIPFRNAGFYKQQLHSRQIFLEFGDRNQHEFNQHLQTAATALDIFFIAEKLRYACDVINYESVLNIRYEILFLEEVLAWAASPAFSEVAVVQVYRNLVAMLRHPDEPAYYQLARQRVNDSESFFPAPERRQLYTLLLNYCTRRINRYNDEYFLHEHLKINKLLLQNELIFENGQLPPWRFTNMATVGLKTGQTAWVWQFLHDYRSRLPAEYADNVFRYNLAQYHYYLKNYDEAQRALLQVEVSDVLLNVTVRSLLIKVYCETGQTDLLLACLEATRLYLHRNRLIDTHLKKQMQKFVEFTAKFGKVMPGDRQRYRALLEQLPPARDMMHREWLAGQIKKWAER